MQKKSKIVSFSTLVLLSLLMSGASMLNIAPVLASRDIIFPVIGTTRYSNDYNSPRDNGPHHATDIIAPKFRPLVAAVSGTITYVGYPQPSWGYMLSIEDSAGYKYNYLHINNDNPGTDDGKGGGMNAYAPDVKIGNKVIRGQLLGYVGDSGNAEGTVSHLHFEMFRPDDTVINPYISLNRAKHIGTPVTPVTQPNEVLPLGNVKRGVRVAMGNFDGDQASEFVAGTGAGGPPRVKVYDGNSVTAEFLAYSEGFTGGVDVATGDIDNDGTDEIIVSIASDGPPKVSIFEPNGTLVRTFLAYGAGFTAGVNVAAGDVDGDGVDEIITGVAKNGSTKVSVFEPDGTPISSFFSYSTTFTGGVDVTAGDIDNDGNEEVITGAGPGTLPQVKAFELDRTVAVVFNAYATNFRGGIRVSADNVKLNNAHAEIVTVPATGVPLVKVFNGSANLLDSEHFMEEWWVGYHDVGAGYDLAKAATGVNHRASVKPGIE